MTLPPRLTDRTFEPDPDRAVAIVAGARRRRRTRAGGALGMTVALVVGVAALGGNGGASGLRVVDPTTNGSGSPTPAPTGSPATPVESDGAGAPNDPGASPEPGATGRPDDRPTPSPDAAGYPPTGTPDDPRGPAPEVSVSRRTIDYDPTVRCDEMQHTSYTNRDVPEAAEYCVRYSWPATVDHGAAVTFTVTQCAVDGDMTSEWDDRPDVTVRDNRHYWHSAPKGSFAATLRARTCWEWTLRWNAVTFAWHDDNHRHLPRGTYEVDVDGAGAAEMSVASHTSHPDRQTTLTVR